MKSKMRCAVAIIMLGLAGAARAGEDVWTFKVTPYLWGAGINGDIGTPTLALPVDVTFLDALKDLDFTFCTAVEANLGPWSFLLDGGYVSLSEDDVSTPIGTVEADYEQWLLQGTAFYQIYAEKQTLVDAGAGLRLFSSDTTINVPTGRADLNPSDTWTDLVLAARVQQTFMDGFYGTAYADLGGFGLASDLTWQIMIGAGYELTEQVAVVAFYRYLDYDYSADGFEYDAADDGFGIGLEFNF